MFTVMDEVVKEFFETDYYVQKEEKEEEDVEDITDFEWIDHLQRKENHNDGSVVAFTTDDMFD